MDDLMAFLNARLDEREHFAKVARLAQKHREQELHEVAAMRAIMDLHNVEKSREQRRALDEEIASGKSPWYWVDEYSCALCGWFDVTQGACQTVRYLAAIWSGHPDYRPEWAALS